MQKVIKANPMKAIRNKCMDCCFGVTVEVKACVASKCPLFEYRGKTKTIEDDLLETIRLKCLDCTGESLNDIRICKQKDCPLYIYRFGRIPRGGE